MIGRMFEKWAVSRQESELQQFVERLQSVNGDELGLVAAMATHLRHNIEREFGVRLLFPVTAIRQRPDLPIALNRLIRDFQRQGGQPLAAGVMVWLHSLRAMSPAGSPRLRNLGRAMWDELERGFDHVAWAKLSAIQMTGDVLNTDGVANRPDGLERLGTR
jgi:hypothetical protein